MRNNCTGIKKTVPALLLTAVLCMFALLSGCGGAADNSSTVKISFVDSIFYSVEQPAAEVPYGEDHIVPVKLRNGYEFVSCDYPDYDVTVGADGQTTLILRRVTLPSRITVKTERRTAPNTFIDLHCTVEYDYNGGKNRKDENGSLTVDYALTNHFRPNTWNGTGLEREGYTLYGWNTRPDGGGEHIGLGSRVTVPDGQKRTLYAEWLRQINTDLFLFKEIAPGECALTGYRGAGDIQPFVIPDKINGMRVTEIASSFTVNMPCVRLSAETLVLPNTVRYVKGNSFFNSSFTELCFSDNIEKIEENAFPDNFKTYRINAVMRPCFQDKNNGIIFADNMDRLIINKDRSKLIFFSGCSFAYGLNSSAVDAAFGGEYEVFNMGVNGDINGAFQMEIMLGYIGKNDVFVHAPEQMSRCQLMASFFTNNTMFVMTEGNYDLLTHVDFSENGAVLRAFSDFTELRKETGECSYSDGRYEDFDIYGDYTPERVYDESTEAERDVSYSDEVYCYEPEFLTEAGIARLAGYYDIIRDNGGRVLVSYAPVNISSRGGSEIHDKGLEFAEKLENMLLPYGYAPMSDVENFMFEGRYFYDSDYHLNDLGAELRTERLIEDLKAAGVGEL